MMPFEGGIESMANGLLILSVVAAGLYLLVLDRTPDLRRTVVKTLPVALLAVLAVVQEALILLAVALALSALGDAFLSRRGEGAFMAGLASFLAAHAVYIALFAFSGAGMESATGDIWRVPVAILMAIFALGMMAVLWPRLPSNMRLPVLVYTAAIFIMGLSALTMNSVVIILGAVLFMISDGLLATERFALPEASRHRAWMRTAVWITYYAAQLLITLGFVLSAL